MHDGDAAEARDELRVVSSPSESDRFGFGVGRLSVPACVDSFDEVARALDRAPDLDLVVVRYAADHVGWFAHLEAIAGHAALHADTLQYWTKPVTPTSPARPADVARARRGTSEDAALLAALVADVFASYRNHYAANPLIAADDALAGYVEWAGGFLDPAQSSRHVLFAEQDGSAVGIAAVATEDDVLEIVLAGVASAARRSGVYAALLRDIEDLASDLGMRTVTISTQAHNTAVMRAWARHGFLPDHTIETVHLVHRAALEAWNAPS